MGIAFEIVYLPPAIEEMQRLNRRLLLRIRRAIEERLGSHADQAGQPLRAPLHGHRKLRVGDYRIIYRVTGRRVMILAVGNRRDVYQDFMRRLGLSPS